MKMTSVSKPILKDILDNYVKGFNGCCVLCPLWDNCSHEDNVNGDCAKDLMRFLESGKDYWEKF